MKIIPSALVSLALLAAALAPANGKPAQSYGSSGSIPNTKELAQALRAGGYVLLVRHGATFSNQADADPFNLSDTTKQRNLNDKGKQLAKAFGEAIRAAGIPIGEIYTSQFNRARETAALAGFTNIETTADLSEGGLVVTPDENNRRAKALRDMLAKLPAEGTNTLLVTHKPNIIDALGKDWFDVEEGEASIFKPEGGTYRPFARVTMEQWSAIGAAAH